MTLRTFAIFIYIFFATKQVCHLCRCTATAAPFSPVSTFFLPCLHLLHVSLSPLFCSVSISFMPRYRLFSAPFPPLSCLHCDVNNSRFCRTRYASARKTSLYGDRQPRCRRPSHPAYGARHPCCRRPPHTQRYMHNRRQRARKRRNNTPQTAGSYALHHQQYFLQLPTVTQNGKVYNPLYHQQYF